jgi:hypothetical protein
MEQRVDLAPPFGIFWGGVYSYVLYVTTVKRDKRRTSEGQAKGVCAGRDPVGSGTPAVGRPICDTLALLAEYQSIIIHHACMHAIHLLTPLG